MTTTFGFVSHRHIWFAFSAITITASIVALALFGLKFGIDFTGGSLLEVKYSEPVPTVESISSALSSAGFESPTIQASEGSRYVIRLAALSEEQHQKAIEVLRIAESTPAELRFDSIGPVIGSELRTKSLIGLIVTLLLIGAYIAFAFRKVSRPVSAWKYGLLTILCGFHDVIIPLGVFAVLGHFFHWEIGASFIAAILTVLGYSISDTVVVFDRTRENLQHHSEETFDLTVEKSIRQTFVRSVNTSMTTLLALTAILIFGGESTRPFALALIIGIAVGTYSSIFIASPALVAWESRKLKA